MAKNSFFAGNILNDYDSTSLVLPFLIGTNNGYCYYSTGCMSTEDLVKFEQAVSGNSQYGSPKSLVELETIFGINLSGSDGTGSSSSVLPIGLQIGIKSDKASRLTVSTTFSLDNLSSLRNIGNSAGDYLSYADNLLMKVSEKQTELGAAQNRLESALDEISIKYENLVSSRSTLRDADIAKVSSQYIQQQILQQASATLLATANQSPSIALQLI